MTWLVTGGAGYIGAHVVRDLLAGGYDVVVLDDLSTGRREFLPDDVELVEGSVTDADALGSILGARGVRGIVHLAALKYAGVSVTEPLSSYHVNVEGTRTVLEEAVRADIEQFVYSSSASIFGTPDVHLVDENTPKAPESPYGEGKLIGEWLCRDVARARDLGGQRPLRYTCLRYFNIVGSAEPSILDVSPHNLFPLLLDALGRGERPILNGDDYPTPDGSCVRDYLHVCDVAEAHVAAVRAIESGSDLASAYNLGRGEGVSVKEIFAAFADVMGRPIDYDVGPRRPGDPARIVTSADRARRDLGWRGSRDLHDMVSSAWSAWQANPGTRR